MQTNFENKNKTSLNIFHGLGRLHKKVVQISSQDFDQVQKIKEVSLQQNPYFYNL